MQKKQPTSLKSRLKNLSSKFKLWCVSHNIPTIALPLVALAVVAICGTLIGGSVVGWDIVGFFKSPTGLLVGAVTLLGALWVILYLAMHRD
jgi:hypothetical protein